MVHQLQRRRGKGRAPHDHPRREYRRRRESAEGLIPAIGIAALWGFGEATLFFIVPDVFLTLVAVRDRASALRVCAAATAGALAGGLVMYLWGSKDPAAASSALLAVPAVSRAMLEGVRESLSSSGALALFLGPATGTPYKIYAVQSGAAGLPLSIFLLVSVPARGLRFMILALAASWASRRPLASWPIARKRVLVAGLWAVFYAVYFVVRGFSS